MSIIMLKQKNQEIYEVQNGNNSLEIQRLSSLC